MTTLTMTEFNRNPSQATRLADTEDVVIMRQGSPAYKLTKVKAPPKTLAALIEAGLAEPAQNRQPGRIRPTISTDIDGVEMALEDRARRRYLEW
ncbi:MAG: hypothetical protein LBB58_05610 [Cellulomonadaceae bacterium]|jgi:hypothetical protein|nr:hypothetical protein [Cellulomonadaceae bacterium]